MIRPGCLVVQEGIIYLLKYTMQGKCLIKEHKQEERDLEFHRSLCKIIS